jgi:hypothetical protein
MVAKNSGFQNSLICLQHPLSLLCIAVLLLNDHVLKTTNPSWFTGKLSDFAGLFFFSFVVCAGISLCLWKFDIPLKSIGVAVFGFVAIWFVFLKTYPPVNMLTANFASSLIGKSVKFVLDPTDLIGLVAFIPAWKLWRKQKKTNPSKFALIVLSIATLSTIATSPVEWTVHEVTDIKYSEEGIIYVTDNNFGKESYPVAESLDGGLTWELISSSKVIVFKEKIYPVQACYSKNSKHCYRVLDTGKLEIMYEYIETWTEVFPSNDITFVARDVTIFPWEDKEYIIVAIGEGGILRRELPDGNWEIINVLGARNR